MIISNYTISNTLKVLLFTVFIFSINSYSNSTDEKLNVIWISCEDMGPVLGTYGVEEISTPNIDKLKKSGVTFKNSFTNNPVCGASRASLLTGLRPTKSRFTTYYTKINEDAPNSLTIASHLKNNGYRTISNGKITHHTRDAAYSWDDIFRGTRNNPKDYKDPINIKNLKNNFGPASEFVYTDDNDYSDGKVAQKTIRDIKSINQSDKPFLSLLGFKNLIYRL